MSKNILVASLVGLAVVAIAVMLVLHGQRGAHIDLNGKILKVRTASIEDNASLAVADFRVTNPADYPFVADKVTLILVDASGKRVEGDTISEIDAKRIFESMPLLGEKYNASLIKSGSVGAHQTVDRMTSARFEVPESAIQSRKNLILRIEEVDGRAVVEIPEK